MPRPQCFRLWLLIFPPSGGDTFHDRLDDGRGNDAVQPPASSREQIAELLFRALTSARKNKHLQVEELPRCEIVPRLSHVVHYQQLVAGIHALSAGFEDLDALVIRPVR